MALVFLIVSHSRFLLALNPENTEVRRRETFSRFCTHLNANVVAIALLSLNFARSRSPRSLPFCFGQSDDGGKGLLCHKQPLSCARGQRSARLKPAGAACPEGNIINLCRNARDATGEWGGLTGQRWRN